MPPAWIGVKRMTAWRDGCATQLPPIMEVKRAIYASALQEWSGDRDWTISVKKKLGDLGLEYKWGVCTASLILPFEREWLFDHTWYAILMVTDKGSPALTRYRRVIVTIQS